MITNLLWGLGNVVDSIANAITAPFRWFADLLNNWLGLTMDYLISIILKIVYEIQKAFFLVVDFIQLLFRKIAGLDTVYISEGLETYNGTVTDPTTGVTGNSISGEYSQDLALVFITSQQVVDVLISLLVVSIILLFVFTFIAIIKNQYNADKTKGANGPIIAKALKALFTFIFVPVLCFIGIYVSNGLLKTIDGATSAGNSTSISGEIFVCAGTQGNRARTNDAFKNRLVNDTSLNFNGKFVDSSTSFGTQKTAAKKIDEAFAGGLSCGSGGHYLNATYDLENTAFKHMYKWSAVGTISSYDYMNTDLVWLYYDLGKYSWLIGFVASFFVAKVLLTAIFGMVQRLYEITILFVISPPFVALMPLDDGKAFAGWKRKFISNVILAYGVVVALNLFFIICPIFQNITLFYTASDIAKYGQTLCDLFNSLGHCIFIIVGCITIGSFGTMISALIGIDPRDDVMARGDNIEKGIRGTVASVASMPGSIKSVGSKVWNKSKNFGSKVGSLGSKVHNAFGNTEEQVKEKAAKTQLDADRAAEGKSTGRRAWLTDKDYRQQTRAIENSVYGTNKMSAKDSLGKFFHKEIKGDDKVNIATGQALVATAGQKAATEFRDNNKHASKLGMALESHKTVSAGKKYHVQQKQEEKDREYKEAMREIQSQLKEVMAMKPKLKKLEEENAIEERKAKILSADKKTKK